MDYFFQLIKILLEEPGKIRAAALLLLKAILVLILSNWLYLRLLGDYQLIDLLSFKDWTAFVLSGRILICAFVFLGGYLFLFYVLPPVSFFPFWLFSKIFKTPTKISRDEGKAIWWFLKKTELLGIDEKKKTVVLMSNTDTLHDMVADFAHPDAGRNIRDIEDSLISEVGHTYVIFMLIYFFLLAPFHAVPYLNKLILTGFVLILIAYRGASILMDLLHKVANDLLLAIDGALFEKKMIAVFKVGGIWLKPVTDERLLGALEFNLEDRKFLIWSHFATKWPITKARVGKLAELAKESKKKLIVLTNKELTASAEVVAKENAAFIQVVCIKEEKDVEQQLSVMIRQEFIF